VHDELVFEVPEKRAEEAKEIIIEEMTEKAIQDSVLPVNVPIEVGIEIGDNWAEAKG
jgi:DNA polymerase I-like protein with 3'-5' exonuclease and polymerase domains